MNVYDTANKLASEIRQSEEYANYKMAKQALNLNTALKEKMEKKKKTRYEAELVEDEEGKRFFEAETKFNVMIADVNKIIGEAVRDVI